LDSAKKEFPEHAIADDVLFKQAEIYLKKGNVMLAVSALEEITKKFPQDIFMDDALFKLAELSENVLKDKANAMKYYEELILNHKGSVYATEARKRFRILRGDKIN
jgi:TolA-binding protein